MQDNVHRLNECLKFIDHGVIAPIEVVNNPLSGGNPHGAEGLCHQETIIELN